MGSPVNAYSMTHNGLDMDAQPYDKTEDPRVSPSGSVKSNLPKILWVNLMLFPERSSLFDMFDNVFDVQLSQCMPSEKSSSVEPSSFICFEYDYPDCESLRVLKNTRERYPDIPIIMFTVQHSEELAVWALRNRVWDYYYKPVLNATFEGLTREIIRTHAKSVAATSSNKHANQRGRRDRRRTCTIHSSYPNEVRFKGEHSEHAIIDMALNYLSANYSHKISEMEVAKLCDLSRFQFSRLFKKVVGSTFQDHLHSLRIEKAKALLLHPSARVVDIAYTVGFSDPSYFTRAFKRITGSSPSVYRASRGSVDSR